MDKDKRFRCDNCGQPLSTRIVQKLNYFNREDFKKAVKTDDYAELLITWGTDRDGCYIEVQCRNCGKPVFYSEDKKLLEQSDFELKLIKDIDVFWQYLLSTDKDHAYSRYMELKEEHKEE